MKVRIEIPDEYKPKGLLARIHADIELVLTASRADAVVFEEEGIGRTSGYAFRPRPLDEVLKELVEDLEAENKKSEEPQDY